MYLYRDLIFIEACHIFTRSDRERIIDDAGLKYKKPDSGKEPTRSRSRSRSMAEYGDALYSITFTVTIAQAVPKGKCNSFCLFLLMDDIDCIYMMSPYSVVIQMAVCIG